MPLNERIAVGAVSAPAPTIRRQRRSEEALRRRRARASEHQVAVTVRHAPAEQPDTAPAVQTAGSVGELPPGVVKHAGRTAAATMLRRTRAALHRAAHPGLYEGRPPLVPKQSKPLHPGATRATPVHVTFKIGGDDSVAQETMVCDATEPVPHEVWEFNCSRLVRDNELDHRGPAFETTEGLRLKIQGLKEIRERYGVTYGDYVDRAVKMSPNARVKYAKAVFEYVNTKVVPPIKGHRYYDVVCKFMKAHPTWPVYVSAPPQIDILHQRMPTSIILYCSKLRTHLPDKCVLVEEDAYAVWKTVTPTAGHASRAALILRAKTDFVLDDIGELQKVRTIGEADVYVIQAEPQQTSGDDTGPRPADPVAVYAKEAGWGGPVAWRAEGKLGDREGWRTGPVPPGLCDSYVDGCDQRVGADGSETLHILLRPRLRGGVGRGRGRGPSARPAGRGRGRSAHEPPAMVRPPLSNSPGTTPAGGAGQYEAPARGRGRGRSRQANLRTEELVEIADRERREMALATIAAASEEREVTTQLRQLVARQGCRHTDVSGVTSVVMIEGRPACSRFAGLIAVTGEADCREKIVTTENDARSKLSERAEREATMIRGVRAHMRGLLLRHTSHGQQVLATALASSLSRYPGSDEVVSPDLLRRVWGSVRAELDECSRIEALAHQRGRVSEGRPVGAVSDVVRVGHIADRLGQASAYREGRRLTRVAAWAALELFTEKIKTRVLGAMGTFAMGFVAVGCAALTWSRYPQQAVQAAGVAAAVYVGTKTARAVAKLIKGPPKAPERRLGPLDAMRFEKTGTFFDILDCTVNDTICLGQPPEPIPGHPDNPIDPDHKIKTWPVLTECDRLGQAGADLFGPAFCWAQVARSCLCNCCNALVNRHAARRPPCDTPLSSVWSAADFALAWRVRARYTDRYIEGEGVWWDWLASANGAITVRSKWPAGMLAKLWRSMTFQPPDPSRTAGFPKREIGKACYEHYGSGALSKGRMIHPFLYDAAKEIMGREFAAWQKALFDVLSVTQPYEYAPGVFLSVGCGVSKGEIATWAEEAGAAWWLESDGSTWDAFVNSGMIQYKHLHMRRVDRRLADFAELYVKTPVSVYGRDQKLEYELSGTVRSGYNDTTSGNSLINGIATAKAMVAAGLRGRILVAGDDMLTAVTGRANGDAVFDCNQVTQFARDFAKRLTDFGIKPKWGAFWDVTQTTFCSAGFYRFGGKIFFLPLLGKQLSKLWWTTKNIAPKNRAKYANGVRKCMLSVVGKVPIYREWVKCCGDDTGPVDAGALAELEREMGYKPAPGVLEDDVILDDEAYAGFAERYDIPEEGLRALAIFFQTLPRNTPMAVGHTVGRMIVEADALDPGDRPQRIRPTTEPP